jgi:septal ring factor EnvC (AmiA/AmiB activator)
MTPEEIQHTMDFILESQANSTIRMDRLEQNMDRLEQNMDRLEQNMDRLEENMARHEQNLARQEQNLAQLGLDHKRQSETVDGLLRVSQALLAVSANMVDRTKRLEGRADSTDESLRVIRELLESNLKPPDELKE